MEERKKMERGEDKEEMGEGKGVGGRMIDGISYGCGRQRGNRCEMGFSSPPGKAVGNE